MMIAVVVVVVDISVSSPLVVVAVVPAATVHAVGGGGIVGMVQNTIFDVLVQVMGTSIKTHHLCCFAIEIILSHIWHRR
jgi:hypothetical protein